MGQTLTDDQQSAFKKDGYLVFESFFDGGEVATLKAAIDEYGAARKAAVNSQDKSAIQYTFEVPALGELVRHPRVMPIVEDILGPGFGFHHLHAVKQTAGTSGVHWHHDYEQIPQTNRSHTMIHIFYYLNGLNGEVGDLLLVPGSHSKVIDKGALSLFGEEDLPGTVVVNDVPPGTMIVVHSALWHARRAKPGGESFARYFADASYCQAGIRWPGYRNNADVHARAVAAGLTEGDRAHLFNPEMFFEGGPAARRQSEVQGSLILQTNGWDER